MRTMRSYFPPTSTILRRSRKQPTNVVEPEFRTTVEMADNRTMAQMLQAPIEGYEDAIIKPNETFNEAWERFKDLLRQCPHHGFSELHQLDTFYNALNPNDQDALDSAAGGNFLDKIPLMRTRHSYFPPTATIPLRSRKQTSNVVKLEIRTIVEMADNRTTAQMLEAPIEGYEDAIVVPPINANNFELKQTLINLVQSNQFTGRQDLHNHL
nr:reverse transcriptase domain-containing protein [Tanacetum cinerariifolium]